MKTSIRARAGRRVQTLLLAVALLLPFAQLGAFVHALSHVAAAGDSSVPPGEACDACVGYSVLGGSMRVDPPAFVPRALSHAIPAALPAAPIQGRRTNHYLPRAPPTPFA